MSQHGSQAVGRCRVTIDLFFSCFLSPQGSPRGRNNVLFSIMIMSRQRFPCHDRDNHEKRSRLRRSLVKAKRFRVTIEICSVAT